jgi:hypothetical protein
MANYKRFIDELDNTIMDALFPGWRGKAWYWWNDLAPRFLNRNWFRWYFWYWWMPDFNPDGPVGKAYYYIRHKKWRWR